MYGNSHWCPPSLPILTTTHVNAGFGVPGGSILCPRNLCPTYALLWDSLRNGTARAALGSQTVACTPPIEVNEAYLLRSMRVPLGFYLSVSQFLAPLPHA